MKTWSILAGIGVLALLVAFPLHKGHAGFFDFFGKSEYIVGSDIKKEAIKEFYFTYSTSTYPPYFQRYVLEQKEGKFFFKHEKREGDHWPLRESDITVKGTVSLSEAQWQEFYGYLEEGKVVKRIEHTTSGRPGPYTFMYWQGDKDKYQEFTFANRQKLEAFEKLCKEIKNNNL